MKKIFIYILILTVIITIIIAINISNKNSTKQDISNFNFQYEMYKNKILQGTDVASIINRAIDDNEKNSVEKDEKGFYIENDSTSVKVSVNFINEDEIIEYPMETINKVGINNFIINFNLESFRISDIKYNSIGKVSNLIIEQIEN